MTRRVNFDSFDLQTRRDIKQSIDQKAFYRASSTTPKECYECGRYIIRKEDHSEYCRREDEDY